MLVSPFENSATLYSRTYEKVISNNTNTDKIEIITGTSFTDLKMTCTLGYNQLQDKTTLIVVQLMKAHTFLMNLDC